MPSSNFVQPTTFTLNIKDISPNFPILPLVNTSNMPHLNNVPQSASSLSSSNYHTVTFNNNNRQSPNQIPSIIQLKNSANYKNNLFNSNSVLPAATPSSASLSYENSNMKQMSKSLEGAKLQGADIPLQYHYLLKKLNKEKSAIQIHENVTPLMRSNTYVNTRDFLNQITKYTTK